jgi:uncharacterized protein (TIGR00369 family)
MPNPNSTLRFLAQPGDVNFGGKMHGGALMRWIDQAGYACAVGYCGCYCVTKYVSDIEFLKPIMIGEIVEVAARVIHTGRTSMHIKIDVCASDPRLGTISTTTECIMVFVAVDEHGHSTPVPALNPTTEVDRLWQRYAIKAMQLHTELTAQMQALRSSLQTLSRPDPVD